jgi:hypothetical protein
MYRIFRKYVILSTFFVIRLYNVQQDLVYNRCSFVAFESLYKVMKIN